jgi:hypothetical protein
VNRVLAVLVVTTWLLVGAFAGRAFAAYLDSGVNWYYSTTFAGQIQCAGVQAAIQDTSANTVQLYGWARTNKDAFCVDPLTAPAGYDYISTSLLRNGSGTCVDWDAAVANAANTAFAHDSRGAVSCGAGQYATDSAAAIAMALDWRTGYQQSPWLSMAH